MIVFTNNASDRHSGFAMVGLGGERQIPKASESLPAPRSGHATTSMVFFFAHLLILKTQIATKI